ncbi:hypothetical protein TNIN_147751, partial [Trichonephila inaurata madagascariensis]
MAASFPNTLARTDALTCTLEASDEVEDVRGTLRHTLNPLYGTKKG